VSARLHLLLCLLLFCSCAAPLGAAVIASSSFDSGAEGWAAKSFTPAYSGSGDDLGGDVSLAGPDHRDPWQDASADYDGADAGSLSVAQAALIDLQGWSADIAALRITADPDTEVSESASRDSVGLADVVGPSAVLLTLSGLVAVLLAIRRKTADK